MYLFSDSIICALSEAAFGEILALIWCPHAISRAISRELLDTQTLNKYQHVAKGPVDSTDTNIVETLACLEITLQEMTNFTIRLLIGWPSSMLSCYCDENWL